HRAAAPCVVHEDVDAAEAHDRGVDGGLTLRALGDVGGDEHAGAAELVDLARGPPARRLVDFGDDDGGPFAGEAPRDAAADPEPRAGDQRDPAVEAPPHRRLLYTDRSCGSRCGRGIRARTPQVRDPIGRYSPRWTPAPRDAT